MNCLKWRWVVSKTVTRCLEPPLDPGVLSRRTSSSGCASWRSGRNENAAMATPTLRAISKRFGTHAEIIGVMRPYVAEVLEGTSWLDRHILYDPKSADRSLSSYSVGTSPGRASWPRSINVSIEA